MLLRKASELVPDEAALVEWVGEYHGVPVRVDLVQTSRTRWEWQVFAHGQRLRDYWGSSRTSRTEATAMRRALAIVARVHEIAEAPWWREYAEKLKRDHERRVQRKRYQRLAARRRQPSLPGFE